MSSKRVQKALKELLTRRQNNFLLTEELKNFVQSKDENSESLALLLSKELSTSDSLRF